MKNLLILALLFATTTAHATEILGIGKPSSYQKQKYAYMKNGRKVKRPQH